MLNGKEEDREALEKEFDLIISQTQEVVLKLLLAERVKIGWIMSRLRKQVLLKMS